MDYEELISNTLNVLADIVDTLSEGVDRPVFTNWKIIYLGEPLFIDRNAIKVAAKLEVQSKHK